MQFELWVSSVWVRSDGKVFGFGEVFVKGIVSQRRISVRACFASSSSSPLDREKMEAPFLNTNKAILI